MLHQDKKTPRLSQIPTLKREEEVAVCIQPGKKIMSNTLARAQFLDEARRLTAKTSRITAMAKLHQHGDSSRHAHVHHKVIVAHHQLQTRTETFVVIIAGKKMPFQCFEKEITECSPTSLIRQNTASTTDRSSSSRRSSRGTIPPLVVSKYFSAGNCLKILVYRALGCGSRVCRQKG